MGANFVGSRKLRLKPAVSSVGKPFSQPRESDAAKKRDIRLPSAVMAFLHECVVRVLEDQGEKVGPETPLFWST